MSSQILLSPVRYKFKNWCLHEINLGRWRNIFGSLALLLLIVGAMGCVSRIAAGRIVAAPNQTSSSLTKKIEKAFNSAAYQKHFLPKGSANPFIYRTIPVGPPDAKLKVLILPPQDYHAKITSKVTESPDGKKNWMSLNINPNPTNTFAALKEPATIVILHGYMMTKESMMPWALLLAQTGYRVVLVDLRGHGQSTGWQISFGKYETSDLSRVLDYLTEQHLCDDRVGVLGLSYGATLALHWAAHDPRVRTVVAIAPYNQPDEAMERLAKEMKMSFSEKTIRESIAIASAKLKLKWTNWSGETALRQSKEPVLLIGAEKDSICPPKDMETLKQFAPSGSKSIQILKANHFVLGYWFHDLAEPVELWFQEHLLNQNSKEQISGKIASGDSR